MKKRGLALIIVIGILGVLAVLAVAFVMMAQLERRASEQRINAARAYLLARSGIEDALARLELGQEPDYGGENWDGSPDGLLNAFEAAEEVYHRTGVNTPADVESCPVRHAMRPAFFTRITGGGPDPTLVTVDGRKRGYSGALSGDYAQKGNTYALKVSSSNAGIYINGGALDEQDRDPDGPGAGPEDFPLNPGAAAEVAPLKPNQVPDHRDVSMEGPNGFLVRLLDNLDAVVTNGATSNLGVQIVGARPVRGYKSLEELKSILGEARYEQFKPYLTLYAWVDPKVVKPQPMDGRPQRWEDIDDAHRVGTAAKEIAGVHADPATVSFYNVRVLEPVPTTISVNGVNWRSSSRVRTDGNLEATPPATLLTLDAGISGAGTPSAPWTQRITATNRQERTVTYPVRWERGFIYAASQLRPAPLALEPRAPVPLGGAFRQILAAALLGLKGTYLEVWEGSAGWDGGFSWVYNNFLQQGYFLRESGLDIDPSYRPIATYVYPSQATEETPWHRTRLDYGMTYGISAGGGRPWYGPGDYDPHALSDPLSAGGKPLVLSAPLGRLKEAPAITPDQAMATADEIQRRITQAGPLRTWARFHTFVDALPRWEDLDEDGGLDGIPYSVTRDAPYDTHSRYYITRRMYKREDLDSDGQMQREVFRSLPGTSWKAGNIAWENSGLAAGQKKTDLASGQVPGLTFLQKDVLKAMANPNTDLNDFNPDANLWKEVDKTDLVGIKAGPAAYAHTTELALDEGAGYARLSSAGRVTAPGGTLLALRRVTTLLELGKVYRDTTQADFMKAYNSGDPLPLPPQTIFGVHTAPYPLAGNQALLSYPEPQTVSVQVQGVQLPVPTLAANATYDGQISLGFVGCLPGLALETLRGDLFDTLDAMGSGDLAVSDLRGPFHQPLLRSAGSATGNVFPDGVYGEKDRSLKYLVAGNLLDIPLTLFYVACWVKPGWMPEASPRAHALVGLSRGGEALLPVGFNRYAVNYGRVPLDDIMAVPIGLYFAPARNNPYDQMTTTYRHGPSSWADWPTRTLIWGMTHSFFASDSLIRRGFDHPLTEKPLGRLEGHRWQHLAMTGQSTGGTGAVNTQPQTGAQTLLLGRVRASSNGGGWGCGFGALGNQSLKPIHADGTANHLRFGEIAGEHNMNYAADATFACVRAGSGLQAAGGSTNLLEAWFAGSFSPAAIGRYYKEAEAAYVSPKLPTGLRPLRITWTEIPCELWFDQDGNGWLGDQATGYKPLNDQFGTGGKPIPNGKRDVHIELEIWCDMGTPGPSDDVLLARYDDPAGDNRIPQLPPTLLQTAQQQASQALGSQGLALPSLPSLIPPNRLYYKAVFVNEWDAATRANYPLDVTPFLDDVSISYQEAGGPRILAYDAAGED